MSVTAKLKLREGEQVLKDGAANLQRGVETVGGRLYLTNQRLVFQPHRFNVQSQQAELELGGVRSVRPCWTKFLNLIPLVPNSLSVGASQGEYRFVLFGRRAWASAIQSALPNR